MRCLKNNTPAMPKVKVFGGIARVYTNANGTNYNINGGSANANPETIVLNLSSLCKEFPPDVYPNLEFTFQTWSVSRRTSGYFHVFIRSSVETSNRRISCTGPDSTDQTNTGTLIIGPDRKMTLQKDNYGDTIEILCQQIQPMEVLK